LVTVAQPQVTLRHDRFVCEAATERPKMSEPAFRPMFQPPHPGLSVKIDCIEPAGLSLTEGAKALGVSRQTLRMLVNGTAGVSPDIARRLAKAFGGTAELWLRLQLAHGFAHPENAKPRSRR
jgi:addiction module HigA family antidote